MGSKAGKNMKELSAILQNKRAGSIPALLSVPSLFPGGFLGVRSGFDGFFSWFPLGSFCCEIQNPVPVLLGFMPPGAGEQLPDSLENHLGQLPFFRFVGNLDFHGLPPFVKIWVRVGKSYPHQ